MSFETDKTKWGDGPWTTEADDGTWYDEATDLPCMIHRNPLGALCGYVGVRPGHPLHGVGYSDLYDYDTRTVIDIDVHGGLTYANKCEGHICHVPREGDTHDIWWFGFDCAHYLDYVPGMEAAMRAVREETGRPEYVIPTELHKSYKTWEYVTEYTKALARQLSDVAAS